MADTQTTKPPVISARPEKTRTIMDETGLDQVMISALVHQFYGKIRADTVLAPIFASQISDWPAHLERMVSFWSSVALMTGTYHGAPMPAHAQLPITWAHFERWLALFRSTAIEVCPPKAAAYLFKRAERIARPLHMAVESQGLTKTHKGSATMTETAPIHDPSALTRFIETRYHARHREQLPQLAQLAERVEAVHFGDENVPVGLSDVLTHMIGEMEVHMKKEELILFPAIRCGGMPGIEQPIAIMRANHDDHAAEVAEIRRLTGGPTLPKGACGTWTALYTGLHAFLTDLEEHMGLENDVLFPQFEPQ